MHFCDVDGVLHCWNEWPCHLIDEHLMGMPYEEWQFN